MTVNPVTDLDLEAFCRRRLLTLTSWEKETLFRLDDAVLAVWANQTPKPKAKSAERGEIPVSNTKGIAGLFRGLMAKKKAQLDRRP